MSIFSALESTEKMRNYFLNYLLLVTFISKFPKFNVSSLKLQPSSAEFDTDTVNKMIELTFNGYNCLNIFTYNKILDYNNIIKAIHIISDSVSVRLNKFLGNNATHHCGFLVFGEDMEALLDFAKVRYDDVIRVLYYIDSAFHVDDDDILQLDTDSIRLHDMDLAVVKLNASDKAVKIFIKSRYESKTRLLHQNFSNHFFHHKNFVPRSVNYKKTVRYMAFDCPLFSIIVNGQFVGGIEWLIYKEIERKLNLTVVASEPPDDKRWGLAFPNGTITGGILKEIYDRNVDVGFCAFWIDFSKLWVGTFSTYYEFECLQFLIPKPKLRPPNWKNILKPLPRTVWILVLLGLVIVSSACYVLRYIEERKVTMVQRGVNIITEWITVIGILLLSKNPEKNHGQSVNRHIFMWWSLFALLITTLYSSSLVSHLTYPQFEPMIETVEGLVKAGYYWGTDYPIMANRFMDVENSYHATFMNSYKKEKNEEERISRLRDGNYSIFAKIVGQKHFMEVDKIPLEMLRNLRTSRECHFYFYVAFVLRKAFPLTLINDQIIRQLIECGIIQYWLDRMFEPKYPLTTFTRVYEYKTPPEEIELSPLRIENLQGAFWIFLIGNQIACIAFVGEILIYKRKQKIS